MLVLFVLLFCAPADGGSCHIFYSRRAMDVPDGLPKWAEHKDASELMPETVGEEQGAVDGEA